MKKLLMLSVVTIGLYAAHNGDYRAYKEGCFKSPDGQWGACNLDEMAMSYVRGMDQAKGFNIDVFDGLCASACRSGKYVSKQEFEKIVYSNAKQKNTTTFVGTKLGSVEVKKSSGIGEFVTFNKKPISEDSMYYELMDSYSMSGGEAVLVRKNMGGSGTPSDFAIAWIANNGQAKLVHIDYPIELGCDMSCIKPKVVKMGDALELRYKNKKVIFKNGIFSR